MYCSGKLMSVLGILKWKIWAGFSPTPSSYWTITNSYKKMVQVFRPTGLRCTACWCVSLQGHLCTFLHYILCWKLVSSTQTPTPPHYQLLTPEQLGTDAIHNVFDTLGGVHRRDFTHCPDFKDCETSPIQATKGYFFFLGLPHILSSFMASFKLDRTSGGL